MMRGCLEMTFAGIYLFNSFYLKRGCFQRSLSWTDAGMDFGPYICIIIIMHVLGVERNLACELKYLLRILGC